MTVGELRGRMTSDEFTGWLGYDQYERELSERARKAGNAGSEDEEQTMD